MAYEGGKISTQLLNFSALVKKENNKTTIAISWDLNGLHHALIRIKKVQAEVDNEVDWSGVEVVDTLTMDQGVRSTEYDGAQEGYKYQIEGIGVDVFRDTSDAVNTPKVEVFIAKAVEPDPSPEQSTEKLFKFHYVPDEGVLPGLIFEQQTEDVINDIGNCAYFAQKTASKALKTGLEASKAARTALNAAQNAQSTADRATELGNTGISKANAAKETADKALKKAEANEVSIAANSSSIATLQNTVNGQQTQLDGNLTNISGLKKQVAENRQSIHRNSKGISQCIMTIQESQRYTTTGKTDVNDLTDYGRIYLPNAFLHCPSGVTYPAFLDVVPSYFGDSEIDDVVVQRIVDANGVSFYRLATEETADATTTYNFGDWKSIDTRYLKLTGGTVTGQTTFSGKLTASGETSVPTPSTANNSKTIANTEFVHGVVSDLVNGAPAALNTLQELATALGNDPNFSTTILNKIGEKESKTDAQIEYKKLQDAIPTKVSQLSNDSGYQKTAEIPLASQTQNGYMSASDKAKLDEITEGSTDVKNYVKSVTEANGKVTVTKGSGETTTFSAGLNILARNKSYVVGDIAYSPNLSSYLYLECTTAGTTGGVEPNMSTLSGGVIVNDGTATFIVRDKRMQSIIDMFYPIGTVYMSADKTKTKADFHFMRHGTWKEVPANLCLQTGNASEAGTQRSAGLPNITGRRAVSWGGGDYSSRGSVTGCFEFDTDTSLPTTVSGDNWNEGKGTGFAFDASLSNPIYGASDTVQPPAYMVRAWVRIE